MATSYHQLGIVAQKRGDYDGALEQTLLALSLFLELRSPNAGVAMQQLAKLHRAMDPMKFKAQLTSALGEGSAQVVLAGLEELVDSESEQGS